jgi:hypothetical protein
MGKVEWRVRGVGGGVESGVVVVWVCEQKAVRFVVHSR